MPQRTAVIIGAGPAGLTAAFELVARTDIRPVVLEQTPRLGGIACTLNHHGWRMDIGGHRFFSKSPRVMRWWLDILPLQNLPPGTLRLPLPDPLREGPDPGAEDRVMLLRNRKSRIYYDRKFFDYPLKLSARTLATLGLGKTVRSGMSYLRSRLRPIKGGSSLETFFINRFGRDLYETFFKEYTEKVWGMPCSAISAEWGSQRVKGLSIGRAISHAAWSALNPRRLLHRQVETSLIEQFLYPKFGPGQLWEEVARRVEARGGKVLKGREAIHIHADGPRIAAVETVDGDGQREWQGGDFFFSTMPVRDLLQRISAPPPNAVRGAGDGLMYRDFITVGLRLKGLKIREKGTPLIRDNWIYIQDPGVRAGRLQIFNNWSPYLAADPSKVWLGVEYFCNRGDELWSLPDGELRDLAVRELAHIGIADPAAVEDGVTYRMEKTYPAYFGTYDRFPLVREYLDQFENLYCIGRNGMHRYNNQDHSMLCAMRAVDNLLQGRRDKSNIWAVNAEQDYHEGDSG
jgi:protoporphyrinogen oxidase